MSYADTTQNRLNNPYTGTGDTGNTGDPPVDSAGGSVAPKNPVVPGMVYQGQYIAAPTSSVQPTTTENVQTTIPYWAAPYTASTLQRAFNLSFEPYQTYDKQMYAGINPMQNLAYNNLFQMTPSAYTNQAAGHTQILLKTA